MKGIDLGKCTDSASIAAALADEMMLGIAFLLRDYDAWTLSDLEKIDAATGGGHAGKYKPFSVKEIVHGFSAGSAATTLWRYGKTLRGL
ncbi:MAG TPA: hypothetical protein PKW98_11395 [Candidatus Wallbacteria bacterium]|nr:MAG: hypothetical protein BWY32_01058 [bacterium ADurb.Bin243]HOD43145.1 hypothetical protein [Candidatus Wallbacteria bacterium]HPG58411.1 hypothetical protein [Candidatus Wallbacteria bacterium]